MICPACNSQFSCGCNARTASDGTQHCVSCINSYEASLVVKPLTAPQTSNSQIGGKAPVVVSVQYKNTYN